MLIARAKLHAALSNLARLVDAKSATPILRHVHLRAAAGALTITATDLTTTVTAILECGNGDLDACLEPRAVLPFLKPRGRRDRDSQVLVQQLPGGRVLLSTEEAAQLVVDCLPGVDAPAHPADGVADDAWQDEGSWPASALEHIEWVLRAAGDDPSRPQLRCVLLEGREVVATNGHIMFVAEVECLRSGPCLLPRSAVAALLSVLPRAGAIAASRHADLIRFVGGSVEVVTSGISETFPAWRQVLPSADHALCRMVVETARLREALKRIPHGRAGSPRLMRWRLNGVLTVEHEQDGNSSVAHVPVDTDHQGPDLVIGLDTRYVEAALAGAGKTVTTVFHGELDPVVMSDGGRVALIMPARI